MLYTLPSGSSTVVYGNNDDNNISQESGAGATLSSFGGSNVIYIQADSSLFTVSLNGSTVTFAGSDGTVFSMPASTTGQSIAFSDGSSELIINVIAGIVTLDGEEVTSTSTAVPTPLSSRPTYTAPPSSDLNLDQPSAYLTLVGSTEYTMPVLSSTQVYGGNGQNNSTCAGRIRM